MQTLLKKTRAYQLLKAHCESKRLSHAYLLTMDDDKNLRATVKLFAKLFFYCAEPSKQREQILSDRIDGETFSDCLFFPDAGKKFVVEDAEKVIEESLLKPVEQDKKVFVISDFSQANPASQNKLLKVLEEPPENVFFLLGATNEFSILPTVLSRVEKLEILPFSEREIEDALTRIYQGKNRLENEIRIVSQTCGGLLGRAQSALEENDYTELVNDAFALCLATGATLPALIKKVGETKQKKELLFLLRLILRDALVWKNTKKKEKILLGAERERIEKVAEKYLVSSLLFAQGKISEAEKQVQFNAYFPQCLEVLLSSVLLQNAKNKKRENQS